jgi:hypothetical protein
MAKRVYARSIPPKELVVADDVKREVVIEDTTKKVREFGTLAEKIAKSSIFHRNWYVPELREKFKFLDRMKRIDMVFPYAKIADGKETMLLIDEPKTAQDVEICAVKAKHLKELGYAYVYIERDTTIYDALVQLGEL